MHTYKRTCQGGAHTDTPVKAHAGMGRHMRGGWVHGADRCEEHNTTAVHSRRARLLVVGGWEYACRWGWKSRCLLVWRPHSMHAPCTHAVGTSRTLPTLAVLPSITHSLFRVMRAQSPCRSAAAWRSSRCIVPQHARHTARRTARCMRLQVHMLPRYQPAHASAQEQPRLALHLMQCHAAPPIQQRGAQLG